MPAGSDVAALLRGLSFASLLFSIGLVAWTSGRRPGVVLVAGGLWGTSLLVSALSAARFHGDSGGAALAALVGFVLLLQGLLAAFFVRCRPFAEEPADLSAWNQLRHEEATDESPAPG